MQKVAVYGSLRKNLHNHRLLETSDFLGDDKINNFSMYSLGSFPFIIPTETEKTIDVEVYEVTPEVFASLDRLEGYPSFYNRMEVDTSHGKSWIYYIEDKETYGDTPEVSNGNWKEYYTGRP